MSVLSKLTGAEFMVVEALVAARAESALLAETGFDSVSEIVAAYKALKRKMEESKQLEEASNKLRRLDQPSLGRMSKELGVPMKEVCKTLAKGGFDIPVYSGFILKPGQLAYLVKNFVP